ncbi:hypothetical protein OG349_26060 [Streptomyces sp. NBC_01317]|uniref:hypothetical protein n=1 Tax=Streptomyces sp. NBC_01317 TaxID=2903822 RepID=UPI002E0F82F8|nr:hypothetical protein OG349_26060 [Streptomyces sp. NBC_01317]
MAETTRREIDEGIGNSELPRIGRLVRDNKGRLGRYMGKAGPYAMLRPVGGGKEWEADLESVESLTDAEALSAEVKETNARSGRRQS